MTETGNIHSEQLSEHCEGSEVAPAPGRFPPQGFSSKSDSELRASLKGFSAECLESAFCFRKEGSFENLSRMLPGMIAFHLPRKAPPPPSPLEDHIRLSEDLGLDSLALAEMAFKMDELFGVPIETREVAGIATVGDLKAFLRRKLLQP